MPKMKLSPFTLTQEVADQRPIVSDLRIEVLTDQDTDAGAIADFLVN